MQIYIHTCTNSNLYFNQFLLILINSTLCLFDPGKDPPYNKIFSQIPKIKAKNILLKNLFLKNWADCFFKYFMNYYTKHMWTSHTHTHTHTHIYIWTLYIYIYICVCVCVCVCVIVCGYKHTYICVCLCVEKEKETKTVSERERKREREREREIVHWLTHVTGRVYKDECLAFNAFWPTLWR